MEKTILRIDASLLKHSHCMRYVWWTLVSGYTKKVNVNDVEYGFAFHLLPKILNDTGSYQDGLKAAKEYYTRTPMYIKPKKKWMTTDHLAKTCFDWYTHWQLKEQDQLETLKVEGAPTTELKLFIPYLATDLFDIVLTGTIDNICRVKGNGCYCIRDYKTTSIWKQEEYLENYYLDPQLKFYRFCIQQMALLYTDSIYAEMLRKGLGCLIEGIFVSSTKEAEVKRSRMFFFKQDEMLEFEGLLKTFIDRLLYYLSLNTLPSKEGAFNGTCSQKFGMCNFAGPCSAPDSTATEMLLKQSFIQKTYDPLNFH